MGWVCVRVCEVWCITIAAVIVRTADNSVDADAVCFDSVRPSG